MKQKGQSLIQVLVGIGVGGIVLAGIASMISNQNRETRALNEYLASKDLERTVVAALSDGTTCQYILNNPTVLTFNSTAVSSTTPQTLTPSLPIYASVTTTPSLAIGPAVAQIGQLASVSSNSLYIKTISLSITGAPSPMPAPGPGASFTGDWVITFDPSKTVRPVKPVSISTTLTVNTTAPGAAFVTSCQASSTAIDSIWQRAADYVDIFYNGGKVGIGTITPTSMLDVRAATDAALAAQIGGSATPRIQFYGDAGAGVGSQINFNTGNGGSLTTANGSGANIYIKPGYGSASQGTTFLYNGDVGIGTTAPKAFLQIQGANTNANANPLLRLGDNTTGQTLAFDNGNTANDFRIITSGNFEIQTGTNADQIFLNTTGGVGIGKVPAAGVALDIQGTTSATAYYYSSDRRLKTDIQPVQDALNSLGQLRGVQFKWKKDGRDDMGLIAQEVESVFPQLVRTDAQSGLKSVEYGNLVALLVEGLKELKQEKDDSFQKQQQQIEALSQRLQALEQQK